MNDFNEIRITVVLDLNLIFFKKKTFLANRIPYLNYLNHSFETRNPADPGRVDEKIGKVMTRPIRQVDSVKNPVATR